MIIPSIDLSEGKVVQLERGIKKRLEKNMPEAVEWFRDFPEVQVIDIDAAKGTGENSKAIRELCNSVNARVGGGIRSIDRAKKLVEAGARKVIIGSKALDPVFMKELCTQIDRERIIVALDSFEEKIVTEGWQEKTMKTPLELVKGLEDFCCEFFFTFVEREGMMQGLNLDKALEMRKATANRVVVAGGISSLEEAEKLDKKGIDCCIGMAIYTGKIKLEDAKEANELDWRKGKGLIPAVVQEYSTGEVLMLAYMNKESLDKTRECGKATYWSRSRKKLWTKGETSGNYQKVKEIFYDCDRDTIVLKVEQKGVACHTGNRSCFYRSIGLR